MIQKISLLLLTILPFFATAQLKKTQVLKAKKGTIHIQLPDMGVVDINFSKAINTYWTYNSNYKFKTEASSNSKQPTISLSKYKLIEVKKVNGIIINKFELGDAYKLNLKVGKKKWGIGFNRTSELSYFDFVEAVKRFQFFIAEIEEEGSWGKAWRALNNKYTIELKDKTLLVDKELLKEKLDESTFRSIYPYSFEFVERAVVEKAILDNDDSKAYFSIVEEKVGSLVQYICDAGIGKVYAHHHSSFQTKQALTSKSFNRYIGTGDLKKLCKNME